MRYFRAAKEIYSVVCSTLDTAYGYPNHATKTYQALPLASELPSDSAGRVYLAVNNEYCGYVLPSQMLPSLIASGSIEEIDANAYMAVAQVVP